MLTSKTQAARVLCALTVGVLTREKSSFTGFVGLFVNLLWPVGLLHHQIRKKCNYFQLVLCCLFVFDASVIKDT